MVNKGAEVKASVVLLSGGIIFAILEIFMLVLLVFSLFLNLQC